MGQIGDNGDLLRKSTFFWQSKELLEDRLDMSKVNRVLFEYLSEGLDYLGKTRHVVLLLKIVILMIYIISPLQSY